MYTKEQVAQMIDHTLLKPEATKQDVEALIAEAKELGTYSVCVSPSVLPVAVPAGLKLACVVGFPSGAHKAQIKAQEAALAASEGVDEIDMVVNLGLVKAADWIGVEEEIRAVRESAPNVVLKVIIESAALSDEEIVNVCKAAVQAEADFVKTSTGFHGAGGASTHAVALMRQTVGNGVGVKASGGIRTAEAAKDMLDAGANRLGLSASRTILQEWAG